MQKISKTNYREKSKILHQPFYYFAIPNTPPYNENQNNFKPRTNLNSSLLLSLVESIRVKIGDISTRQCTRRQERGEESKAGNRVKQRDERRNALENPASKKGKREEEEEETGQ